MTMDDLLKAKLAFKPRRLHVLNSAQIGCAFTAGAETDHHVCRPQDTGRVIGLASCGERG